MPKDFCSVPESDGVMWRLLSVTVRKRWMTYACASGILARIFHRFSGGMDLLRADFARDVSAASIPVARLILRGKLEDTLRATEDAVIAGYRTLKYKVGGRAMVDDIEMIRRVQAMIPYGVRVRLDANRSWSMDETVQFCRGIEGLKIEFIEEPLNDVSAYATLEQQTDLPIALDESLVDSPELLDRSWKNLTALVIKPMRLGGRVSLNRLFQQARDRGVYCVISSMYESGVGIRALLALAAEKTPGIAAGLDTYGSLADDVVTPRLATCAGTMETKQANRQNWTVDMNKLERVA
jgi:O-succinylbenzoate synthase